MTTRQDWLTYWEDHTHYAPYHPDPEPLPAVDHYIPEEDEGPDDYEFHPRATIRWREGTGHDSFFTVTSERYLEDTTP